MVHHHHLVADCSDILHRVRYQQNSVAALLMIAPDLREQNISAKRIQTGTRLVEYQNIGIHRDHTGDRGTALFTAGQIKG